MNPENKRLMAVFAHPDDAEIWAGGTLAKWTNMGGIAKILCFSKDTTRVGEAIAGAKVLGSEIAVLESIPVVTLEIIKLAADKVENFNPDVVITHHHNDSHPEHRNVFEIVSNAIIQNRIKNGNPQLLLSANTYNEICLDGVFNPNVFVDISAYLEVKLKSIEKHASQPYEMWKTVAVNQNTALGSRLSNVKYAEGYTQVPILGKLANISLF